jgi:hypothetical protein
MPLACILLWITPVLCAAQPPDFSPRDLAAEVSQSRIFENASQEDLMLSCLFVIQDIKFFVTEIESDTGLIVATAPAAVNTESPYTLTITLRAAGDPARDYQVRLLLHNTGLQTASRHRPRQVVDSETFYLDFFSHLNSAYFRERVLQ